MTSIPFDIGPTQAEARATNLVTRTVAALAQGGERRLSVLIFHRVTPERDPLFPEEMHAVRFTALVRMLARDFNVVRLDEAVARIARNALPRRAVSITFDDGYADNHTVASPILRRHGLTATMFVASGFLDGGVMWNDAVIESIRNSDHGALDLAWLGLGSMPLRPASARRAAIDAVLGRIKYLPPAERGAAVARVRETAGGAVGRGLMMTSAQVRALADDGMAVGGHTLTHPILTALPDDDARREIGEDRERLAGILGTAPWLFAYPNGKPRTDYGVAHVRMVRDAGYTAALSTARGSAGRESDRYQIPRFTPWDESPLRFGLRLVGNYRSKRADTA